MVSVWKDSVGSWGVGCERVEWSGVREARHQPPEFNGGLWGGFNLMVGRWICRGGGPSGEGRKGMIVEGVRLMRVGHRWGNRAAGGVRNGKEKGGRDRGSAGDGGGWMDWGRKSGDE